MLTTITVVRVMQSKFTETNPKKISNGVARARCTGPGSAFVKLGVIFFYFLFSMHDLWLAKGTLKNLNYFRIGYMHFHMKCVRLTCNT